MNGHLRIRYVLAVTFILLLAGITAVSGSTQSLSSYPPSPAANLDGAGSESALTGFAGRVKAESDLAGLSMIRVEVYYYDVFSSSWQNTYVFTNTDLNGRYKFSELGPGFYRVHFSDYAGVYAEEYYDDAQTLAAATDVVVNYGQITRGINAFLPFSGSIKGKVVSKQEGLPLPDITVKAWQVSSNYESWGWYRSGEAVTDSSGEFMISGLNLGNHRIQFIDYENNYSDEFFSGAWNINDATDVVVQGGQTTPDINAFLSPTGTIAGLVTSAMNDAPLKNVDVFIWHYDSVHNYWDDVADDNTNVAGQYLVTGLDVGNHRVLFRARSDFYAGEYYDDVYDLGLAEDVGVESGQVTSGINAALGQSGGISGKVTAKVNGWELEGMEVLLLRYDYVSDSWSEINYAETDPEGDYEFSGLPPTNHLIKITDPYYEIFANEYFEDVLDPLEATAIGVEPGKVTHDINAAVEEPVTPGNDTVETPFEIILPPFRDAQDTMAASTDAADPYFPCVGEQLYNTVWHEYTPRVGGPVTVSTEDSDYDTVLAIWKKSAEKLEIIACNDGYVFDPQARIDNVILEAGETYVIETASLEELGGRILVLSLSADPGHITGMVTAESDGSRLPGITVDVYRQNETADAWGLAATAVTDSNGRFDVDTLFPDIYRVKFSDESGAYLAEYFDDASDPTAAKNVTVLAGKTTFEIDAALVALPREEPAIFIPIVARQSAE